MLLGVHKQIILTIRAPHSCKVPLLNTLCTWVSYSCHSEVYASLMQKIKNFNESNMHYITYCIFETVTLEKTYAKHYFFVCGIFPNDIWYTILLWLSTITVNYIFYSFQFIIFCIWQNDTLSVDHKNWVLHSWCRPQSCISISVIRIFLVK